MAENDASNGHEVVGMVGESMTYLDSIITKEAQQQAHSSHRMVELCISNLANLQNWGSYEAQKHHSQHNETEIPQSKCCALSCEYDFARKVLAGQAKGDVFRTRFSTCEIKIQTTKNMGWQT